MTLAMDTRLIRTRDIPEAALGADEIALLSADSSRYFGLAGPANTIWKLLEAEQTL